MLYCDTFSETEILKMCHILLLHLCFLSSQGCPAGCHIWDFSGTQAQCCSLFSQGELRAVEMSARAGAEIPPGKQQED